MDDTRVVDSRPGPDGLSVRRRRRCETCGKRITTFETVRLSMPQIIKSDGRRQDFSEEKLRVLYVDGAVEFSMKVYPDMSAVEFVLATTEAFASSP